MVGRTRSHPVDVPRKVARTQECVPLQLPGDLGDKPPPGCLAPPPSPGDHRTANQARPADHQGGQAVLLIEALIFAELCDEAHESLRNIWSLRGLQGLHDRRWCFGNDCLVLHHWGARRWFGCDARGSNLWDPTANPRSRTSALGAVRQRRWCGRRPHLRRGRRWRRRWRRLRGSRRATRARKPRRRASRNRRNRACCCVRIIRRVRMIRR